MIKNKSGGGRRIRTRATDDCSGLSKRNLLKVTENDMTFRRFNAQFTNKAFHKPVHARKVPSRDKGLRELFCRFREI